MQIYRELIYQNYQDIEEHEDMHYVIRIYRFNTVPPIDIVFAEKMDVTGSALIYYFTSLEDIAKEFPCEKFYDAKDPRELRDLNKFPFIQCNVFCKEVCNLTVNDDYSIYCKLEKKRKKRIKNKRMRMNMTDESKTCYYCNQEISEHVKAKHKQKQGITTTLALCKYHYELFIHNHLDCSVYLPLKAIDTLEKIINLDFFYCPYLKVNSSCVNSSDKQKVDKDCFGCNYLYTGVKEKKEKIQDLVGSVALLATATRATINTMATTLETACQFIIKLIEEHCLTCDFYYRNRCIMNSYNFCFNKAPKLSKEMLKDLITQIKNLYDADKIEERILADILTVGACYLKYSQDPKTKQMEITRLDPTTIITKETVKDVTFIPTPYAQQFFDGDSLKGTIRYNLRKHIEQATDFKNVLRKAYSFPEEIFLKVALNEANWNEVLSLKSDERKWPIELEYTDPARQVISKEFITTVELSNREERVIFITAMGTKKPAVVKGKMARTSDDLKELAKED